MEFYIVKIAAMIFYPHNIFFFLLLVLIFFQLFTNFKKLTIFFSKILLILFLFFGYTPLSNFLLNKVEDYIKPSKYPVQQLEGIIILGGAFDSGKKAIERNELFINSGAERLTKALEIYKKNPKILILYSGFSSDLSPRGFTEEEQAKKFFLEQGVKQDNLIFENQARTTYENVYYSKNILKKHNGTWGFITSASHVPRSFFTFKKQGLILEPIIVDYITGNSKVSWVHFSIMEGLSNWSIIIHEVLGLIYYKISKKI